MAGSKPAQTSPEDTTNTASADDIAPDLDVDNAQNPNSELDTNTSNELQFEKEPFDAGVEADEESDPKKYIEQLTGKLGQSLRKYTETQGQPDFELEKFAVNSLLSATHTGEMDSEDQKDIIKKVEDSGSGSGEEAPQSGEEINTNDNLGGDDDGSDDPDNVFSTDEDPLNEMSLNDHNTQSLIRLYDNGDDRIRAILSRLVSFSEKIDRDRFIRDLSEDIDYDDMNYILEKLNELGIELPMSDEKTIDETMLLKNPPKNNMFQDGSNDILQEKKPCWGGYEQIGMKDKNGKEVPNCVKIKETLDIFKKNHIFDIKESLNQDDMVEPKTKPMVKPMVKPTPNQPVKPTRKNKPFLPDVTPGTKTQPKAMDEGKSDYQVYHNTFSSAAQTGVTYAKSRGYDISDEEIWTEISVGKPKPEEGNYNRYSLKLIKNGKEQKKMLHMQIYNTGNKYELNAYIN